MVKKLRKTTTADKKAGAQLSGTVKESAQQIWLAGLGAFAKAQEEGGKVFEALVKEGTSIQRKTQAAAEEKISEATNRMATHGHRHLLQGLRPVGQAGKHLRGARVQGAEQAGRSLGQGHRRADRAHRGTQSQRRPAEREVRRRRRAPRPAPTPPSPPPSAHRHASRPDTGHCFACKGASAPFFRPARLLQRNKERSCKHPTLPFHEKEKTDGTENRTGARRRRPTRRHLRDRRPVRAGRSAGRAWISRSLHHYVGVSAGGFIAAGLANGMSPRELCAAFIECDDGASEVFDPSWLMVPAYDEFARRAIMFPGLAASALWRATFGRKIADPVDRPAGPQPAHRHLLERADRPAARARVFAAGPHQ